MAPALGAAVGDFPLRSAAPGGVCGVGWWQPTAAAPPEVLLEPGGLTVPVPPPAPCRRALPGDSGLKGSAVQPLLFPRENPPKSGPGFAAAL